MFWQPRWIALTTAVFLCTIVCILVGWSLFNEATVESARTDASQKEYVVTLTKDGFSPAEVVLQKGDTVRFNTSEAEPFWPASDLHPTHTIYSEFDPKRPIQAGEEWSFTFFESGRWRYHDHLGPQHLGLIIVQDAQESMSEATTDCEALEGPEKLQCFDQMLEKRLKEGGIESAFEYFLSIYHADREVPAVCHGWTHRLGEVEYGLYKEGKEVSLRPEASFCDYGYFHGFINAMVEDTQSLEQAQQFCADAVAQKQDGLGAMQSICIHGIGHSISTLALESKGHVENIIDAAQEGARACEKLYAQSNDLCIDGMLHELYLNMVRGDYGLSEDEYLKSGDIFYYCHDQSGALAEACYHGAVTLWSYFIGSDKKEVMRYVLDSITNQDEVLPRVLHTLVRSFIEVDIQADSFQDSVDACAMVPERFLGDCMRGLALGFVTHGEPGKMHEKGFAFCRNYYTGSVRQLCIQKMINELSNNYNSSEFQRACSALTLEERPMQCMGM